jgi:hypothetical protein
MELLQCDCIDKIMAFHWKRMYCVSPLPWNMVVDSLLNRLGNCNCARLCWWCCNGGPPGSTTSGTWGKRGQAGCMDIVLLQPFQKIRLGTFCYFQDGNGIFPSFTGSFWQYATSGGIWSEISGGISVYTEKIMCSIVGFFWPVLGFFFIPIAAHIMFYYWL